MKLYHVIAFLFLCLSAGAADIDEQKFLDKAMDALESDDYTNALHMLTERIEGKKWQLYFLHELRADSYFELKEFEKARDDYLKATPRAKKGDIEYKLGKTYERLKDYGKALYCLDRSIELADDGSLQEALARYYKGRVLAALLEFNEARVVLLKIDPAKTPKDLMGEVQVMLDFCRKGQKLKEVK